MKQTIALWAVLILALSLFGYLTYEVGRISDTVNQLGDPAWKTQATSQINIDTQNINAIVRFLQTPKK